MESSALDWAARMSFIVCVRTHEGGQRGKDTWLAGLPVWGQLPHRPSLFHSLRRTKLLISKRTLSSCPALSPLIIIIWFFQMILLLFCFSFLQLLVLKTIVYRLVSCFVCRLNDLLKWKRFAMLHKTSTHIYTVIRLWSLSSPPRNHMRSIYHMCSILKKNSHFRLCWDWMDLIAESPSDQTVITHF